MSKRKPIIKKSIFDTVIEIQKAREWFDQKDNLYEMSDHYMNRNKSLISYGNLAHHYFTKLDYNKYSQAITHLKSKLEWHSLKYEDFLLNYELATGNKIEWHNHFDKDYHLPVFHA